MYSNTVGWPLRRANNAAPLSSSTAAVRLRFSNFSSTATAPDRHNASNTSGRSRPALARAARMEPWTVTAASDGGRRSCKWSTREMRAGTSPDWPSGAVLATKAERICHVRWTTPKVVNATTSEASTEHMGEVGRCTHEAYTYICVVSEVGQCPGYGLHHF